MHLKYHNVGTILKTNEKSLVGDERDGPVINSVSRGDEFLSSQCPY